MRKAKIICTIGPASNNRTVIGELVRAGMDVARLNFSHGDYTSHNKAASYIRQEAKKQNRVVSILQDLQGIKIRLSEIEGGSLFLKTGDEVFLYPGSDVSREKSLFISYPALLNDSKEGDRILLDDGLIELRVTENTMNLLKAVVVEGGVVKSKKGVNLPSSKTTLPSFTDKDKEDLKSGVRIGVDYIAISFVRSASDVEVVREWAEKNCISLPPLVAKIEKPEALDNISEIMDIVDGIMVARGDLGVEMSPERVPVIQKMLIDMANRKAKFVITATQMLESMTVHSRPTRAEANDVANAVIDGTDALMLSAETASGKHPVESLKMMDTIIRYTEENLPDRVQSFYKIGNTFPEAIADGACKAARDIGAKAIVVFTNSGFTARLISKLKPSVQVVAFTPEKKVLKTLPLYWGTVPKLIEKKVSVISDSEFMLEIERILLKGGLVQKGESIVFVASSAFLGKPNIIRLHTL